MLENRKTAALVKKAAAGDKQAFISLIEPYRQYLYATAMAVTHNQEDAMDAVQDTLLILWEKLGSLRNPGAFRSWMTRILVNNCCGICRNRGRETPLDDLEETETQWEGDGDASLDVRSAMARMSDGDRLLLQLFYFEDLPVKEIAKALSLTPEAVRMRLSRCRKRFREQYGSQHSKT